MRPICYDFQENRERIEKMIFEVLIHFKEQFRHVIIVNMACLAKFRERILDDFATLGFKNGNNLFLFYGKLYRDYNGDDHKRFLEENGLYRTRSIWTSSPQAIRKALEEAHLI
ncbi:hypothetical protein C4572_02030 [Candidatus Parcubacteria bacterium]|nr:MAG: hypothetical protein C4572_02030 [Candidatus Parcubacteria bacterium]